MRSAIDELMSWNVLCIVVSVMRDLIIVSIGRFSYSMNSRPYHAVHGTGITSLAVSCNLYMLPN